MINNSASGGAFPSIESCMRKNNDDLIVYGAAFDETMHLKHFRAKSEFDSIKFRGSKYVESDIKGIYNQVKEDLLNNKEVLFTGTPCQVAGLKYYLINKNIETKKLILIDVLCHGTPSKKCWEDYIQWLEKKYNAKVIHYSFRNKGKRILRAEFDNGKILIDTNALKVYFELFNSPRMIQEKCFKCKFAGMKNESDISIGDFWGIENVMKDFPFKKGVSIVITNTLKGEKIINKLINENLSNEKIVVEKCNDLSVCEYNPPLKAPSPRLKCRDRFLKDYEKGWEYLYKKYCLKSFIRKIKHKLIG